MTILSHVEAAQIRWHERSIIRNWPDAEPSALPEHSVADDEGASTALHLALGRPNDRIGVRIRVAVQVSDNRMTSRHDCEIEFILKEGATPPSTADLKDMVLGWGTEYVLGFVRSGIADSARLMGLPAPIIPAGQVIDIKDDELELLVSKAQDDYAK